MGWTIAAAQATTCIHSHAFLCNPRRLTPVIVEVERGSRFRYVQYGVYENRVFPEFKSGLDIPDLIWAKPMTTPPLHATNT
jgi:hypothetical protein